jgi:hypothetical protein
MTETYSSYYSDEDPFNPIFNTNSLKYPTSNRTATIESINEPSSSSSEIDQSNPILSNIKYLTSNKTTDNNSYKE